MARIIAPFIFKAVEDNDIVKLSEILENKSIGYDINYKNQDGLRALHLAIVNNNMDIVKLLLGYGADVTAKTIYEENCLHLAVKTDNVDVLDMFLTDALVNDRDIKGCTPLHIAASENRYNAAEHLLKNNDKIINVKNDFGETPLHRAVKEKHYSLIQLLLKCGADPNLHDKMGESAFHFSFMTFDNYTVTDLFLKYGADINDKSGDGRKALHYAAMYRKYDTLSKLLENNVNVNVNESSGEKNTTLMDYVIFHNPNSEEILLQMIKLLVHHGADINFINKSNETPLYLAIAAGRFKIIDYLLESKADPNGAPDHRPIILVIVKNNVKLMQRLISYGADVTVTDSKCENALLCAMDCVRNLELRYAFVELLLKHGFKISDCRKSGSYFLAKTLLQRVIDSKDLKLLTLLLEHEASVDESNCHGETALFTAVFAKFYDAAKLLIANGANVNHKNYDLVSILSLAVATRNEAMVNLLLSNNANINSRVLKEAARGGVVKLMKILLAHDGMIELRGALGEDIFIEAIDAVKPDMLQYLLYHADYINLDSTSLMDPMSRALVSYETYRNQNAKRCIDILIKHVAFCSLQSTPFDEDCIELMRFEERYQYYTACMQDLEKLKGMKICPSGDLTYYDLLVKRKSLVNYLRWESIDSVLKSGNYKAECGKYADELEIAYATGVTRLKLVDEYSAVLYEIFKNVFPCEVVFNICECLTDRELTRNLKKAAK